MDILTHTLSGIAIGTVISSFSKKGFGEKLIIIAMSGFGGALPDFDAITLWSHFDNVFGKILGLHHTGKEIYFSKFWYSHHAIFHSILASIVIALFIGLTIFLLKKVFSKKSDNILSEYKDNFLILFGFICGFIIHLFEDMPTPSYVWGGVNLFWPSRLYIGGTGDIWWWNNYDIFLIVIGVVIINVLILILSRFIRFDARKFTVSVFLIGSILCLIQIKTRGYSFNYKEDASRFKEFEEKSKEIQKRILGDYLFKQMVKFDTKVGVNF